ncbi:hypothetical protein TU86_17385 [Pseudomonas weihenstephanensis]|uniref:Histidine kinase n=1 Tax=Pseudomonas weihenstephanensis TaxID=1608994 RepID=A0A0J6LDH6_9PSED|nr:EAL domain-containing protein [Pseudomonas weihenstephanensis]KMN12401.1 hypothetical protein TU86_17385 [Pseudomonas weihenstephanensis]
MLLDIIENLALLMTLCWLHETLIRNVKGHILLSKICTGALFGLVCIVGMMTPLVLAQGIIIDGRTVILSLSALFGGPLVGLIAGCIAGLYRFWVGGVGAIPGLLNILMSVLMGMAFHYLHQKRSIPLNALSLLIFGCIVQGLQILNIRLLSEKIFAIFVENALWPLVFVQLLSTLLLGLILRNIHQQKNDREALHESEAYLRAITEAMPDTAIVIDQGGNYTVIKSSDKQQFPTSATRPTSKHLQDSFPQIQVELLMQFIHMTLASNEPQTIEYSMQTQIGKRIFEGRARRLDILSGDLPAVIFMARDITERVALEQEIRISAIAFECQQGMLITDAQTRIIKVNGAFSKLSGYSEAEVMGQPTRILASGKQGPQFYKNMWQTLKETGGWAGEIWNRHKDGEISPEWLTISAVHDEHGQVNNYVASFIDISERKNNEQKIQHLAFFDPLTGLPNRRLLYDRLQQALVACSRKHTYAALIFLDLDDFKNINDLHGHKVGDELLCHVSTRLANNVRELDTVARLGGDEFVILLEELKTGKKEAAIQIEHVVSKLLKALHEPYLFNHHRLTTSASMGVVLFNDEQYTPDELMQHADLSMYGAKASGKNSMCFYDPQMQAAVSMSLKLEQDIGRGLTEGEFKLFLQPQVNIQGELEGVEALTRWQHPQLGILGPDIFIEIAERSDLIELIDMEGLHNGCLILAEWAKNPRTANLSLSVNISTRTLYKTDFTQSVTQSLTTTQANPLYLKLEITESILLKDKKKAAIHMQALRELGISFSIDDFGIGYSSMSYLQQLPLDQLKIDQSFVRDLPESTSSLAIVCAILAMAQSLGLEVIAEGVENLAQHDSLIGCGCRHFQGYLFGKPVIAECFEALILDSPPELLNGPR